MCFFRNKGTSSFLTKISSNAAIMHKENQLDAYFLLVPVGQASGWGLTGSSTQLGVLSRLMWLLAECSPCGCRTDVLFSSWPLTGLLSVPELGGYSSSSPLGGLTAWWLTSLDKQENLSL